MGRRILILSMIVFAGLLVGTSPGQGDQVIFKNGNVLQAKVLEKWGDDFLQIEFHGGIIGFPWTEVKEVILDPKDGALELTPPQINASSALLIDEESGRIILEKDSRKRRPIASLTKLMSAVIILENGNLEDMVRVSKRAAATRGSSMGLRSGQRISLKDLLLGMLVKSANDAAVAAAEHLSGDEDGFVREMNRKALSLGLQDTHFSNCHGFDHPIHYSTAYDMAILSQYAMSLPFIADCVKNEKVAVWLEGFHRPSVWRNSNRLLSFYLGADGIKTGYTQEAGKCLVGSASRGGRRLIAVLLNDNERWHDACELFEYGFSFLWKERIQNLRPPEEKRVYGGESDG